MRDHEGALQKAMEMDPGGMPATFAKSLLDAHAAGELSR